MPGRIGRITHLFVRLQSLLGCVGATGWSSIRPEKWPGTAFQGLNRLQPWLRGHAFPRCTNYQPSRHRGCATLGSQSWAVLIGSSSSAEQSGLGRRPAMRPSGSLGLRRFRIQVAEKVLSSYPPIAQP